MSQGKVIPINPKDRTTRTTYLLEECRTITTRYLPELLKRMLDNADDNLFELADKADSNQEQNNYFDAMRELRRVRQTLEQGFLHNINNAFSPLTLAASAALKTRQEAAPEADEMCLVDETTLEESLAISGMVSKMKSLYACELYAVEQRLAAILPGSHIDLDTIPVGPKAICNAFDQPIKTFDSDIKIKLIMYKLFDKHVLANLKPLYDEINVLFSSAGILPKLKMRIEKKNESYRPRPPAADLSWLEDGAVSMTQTSLDRGIGYRDSGAAYSPLLTLSRLLDSQASLYPAVNTARQGNGERGMAQNELVDMLSKLQQTEGGDKSFAVEIANLRADGKLNQIDDDIISIVEMLFDFILDDPNLPAAAKALLARLQLPMLKVALLDAAFFRSKQHPARKLLNAMAKASIGLGNDSNSDNCALIAKIEEITLRINNSFIRDDAIFSAALTEFEAFLKSEAEAAQESQQLSQQRIQERERQALSRAWVTNVIAAVVNGKELPKPVFELIDGPWKEVMVNTYLNEGEASDHWKENLRFIDILIWSTEPMNGKMDKQRLSKIIAQLVGTLRDELKNVYYPPARIDEILTNLETLHIAGIRGERNTKLATVRIKADPAYFAAIGNETQDIAKELDAMRQSLAGMANVDDLLSDVLSDINPDKKRMPFAGISDDDIEVIEMASPVNQKTIAEIDDAYWQMVQTLETGQWISLSDSRGKEQKMKLAWKSDLLGECTFINWKFKVAGDFSFNQLAAKFRSGQASLIESLPIFERAIDAVMNSLQRPQPGLN